MIKRWEPIFWTHGVSIDPEPEGDYVLYSDYQILQGALGEALKEWEDHVTFGDEFDGHAIARVWELRKQFLDTRPDSDLTPK